MTHEENRAIASRIYSLLELAREDCDHGDDRARNVAQGVVLGLLQALQVVEDVRNQEPEPATP